MAMADPFKQLASVMDMRMAGHAARAVSGVPCELGTIMAAGLKLDSFKHEIKDYLVADWLAKMYLPAFSFVGAQTGLRDSLGGSVTGQAAFSFHATTIDQVRLDLKTNLKPGDRVLVVPINGGQDVVVIAKVIPNA